jgi:methyltransferase (TIGR00027 family)
MTAIGVAHVRAVETARADRLFADPLAAEFVAASGWSPAAEAPENSEDRSNRFWQAIQLSAVVRTRFLDELVEAACDAGCRQVVLLGAGLDARAYRLGWPPGTRLFELDLADVLDFKQSVLASREARARCERIPVPCDLGGDWPGALLAAGFHTDIPTAWVAEGLLIYLSEDQVDRILDRVGELSPAESRLGLTLAAHGFLERSDRSSEIEPDDPVASRRAAMRAMWKSTAPEDPAAWLSAHGWTASVVEIAELARTYGRPMPLEEDDGSRPAGWLVGAVR